MKHRNWDEFQEGAADWPSQLSRRDFIELAGASIAFAGLAGCTRPPRDHVYPYVDQPENSIPGKPVFFATSRTLLGLASGLLVETHEGRPTKIEGNPDHSANQGSAWAWQQASILSLYDPDRAQNVLLQNQKSSWKNFYKAWNKIEPALLKENGEGLTFVSEISTSSTLHEQMKTLKRKFPKMHWLQWEPNYQTHSLRAAQDIFKTPVSPVFDFTKAAVIVSFDADFLAGAEYPASYARDFMKRRRTFDQGQKINHIFMAETAVSLTGLKASSRIGLTAIELENLCLNLYEVLEKKINSPIELGPVSRRASRKKSWLLHFYRGRPTKSFGASALSFFKL